ncbi:hypothetical protein Hanom_Chr04g00333671 [Helianthus anomalus]
MRTGRKYRSRRVTEILKTLDAAEAMLRLGSLTSEKTVESDRFSSTVLHPCRGRNGIPCPIGVDVNAGVTRLSANVLMQSFPSDRRGRYSIVYKRRQSWRPSTTTADAQMTTSAMGDGEGENPWIADPHPLEWYGEALHTPLEVLAMLPDS